MSNLNRTERRPFIDTLAPLGLSSRLIALAAGRECKEHDISNDVTAMGGMGKNFPKRPSGAEAYKAVLRYYAAGVVGEQEDIWMSTQSVIETYLGIAEARAFFDGLFMAEQCFAFTPQSKFCVHPSSTKYCFPIKLFSNRFRDCKRSGRLAY